MREAIIWDLTAKKASRHIKSKAVPLEKRMTALILAGLFHSHSFIHPTALVNRWCVQIKMGKTLHLLKRKDVVRRMSMSRNPCCLENMI